MIIYLRSNYHFGRRRFAMYRRRYHEITIGPSGVWRILKRLGMNRLPASQRYRRHKDEWERYEKAQPRHRIGMNVKFIRRSGYAKPKNFQYTAIDDCTHLRIL